MATITNPYVPKKAFLTRGVGKHKQKLTSFELALRDMGVAPCNLVRVSSIFPPKCQMISPKEGVKYMDPGQIVFCVLAESATNEPHRLIASSIGVAIPKEKNNYGYLSEHHCYGASEKAAGDYAEDLAADMFATTHGVDQFDPDECYDAKNDLWKIRGKVLRTRSITQTAVGDKNGLWTTVVSGCIFIL